MDGIYQFGITLISRFANNEPRAGRFYGSRHLSGHD